MPVLTARQCPQCDLRFASSSELDQHVRLDHRPAPRPASPVMSPEPAPQLEDRPATEAAQETSRLVVRAIISTALLTFVAVVSWHVAALLSVALIAAVAAHASVKSRRARSESTS